MITVVGYTYMINDWEERLIKQLERIKLSNLYDKSDEIYLVVCDSNQNNKEKINLILEEYPKYQLKYHIHNWYEAHALSFIDDLGRDGNDRKILYFHTKGVFNKYKNFNTEEIHDLKINGIRNWVEILEFFLIDKWEECVEKLETFDTVGVTNSNNWWWGNFWWTNSKHIKNNIPFKDYFSGSRWCCEAWLHESNNEINNIKKYEFFHFTFNPYYTFLPKYFYDGTDLSNLEINVINAEYGYFSEQTDEGRELIILDNKTIDVTEKVKNIMLNKKYFNFNPEIIVDFDPAPGFQKSLRFIFTTNFDKDKQYTITTYNMNNLNFINK